MKQQSAPQSPAAPAAVQYAIECRDASLPGCIGWFMGSRGWTQNVLDAEKYATVDAAKRQLKADKAYGYKLVAAIVAVS